MIGRMGQYTHDPREDQVLTYSFCIVHTARHFPNSPRDDPADLATVVAVPPRSRHPHTRTSGFRPSSGRCSGKQWWSPCSSC